MAPPAVRETLKEGRDRSKHTDGEINVSIEINYYRPKKWRMIPLKRLLGQICIFWGILALFSRDNAANHSHSSRSARF